MVCDVQQAIQTIHAFPNKMLEAPCMGLGYFLLSFSDASHSLSALYKLAA